MLKEVLRKHYANYTNQSVENIKRDAKGLLHIISDYEGRVVFELLQNAFDRADKNIKICIKNGFLYVANDGIPFTYVLDFDYENGQNEIRGDFQSICSVYTSSKTVSSAIGNKGIGFKSVFSIAKKQNPKEVYPTRSVDIFTKGEFIDPPNTTSQIGAFRLCEMIRQAEVLTSIFNDADLTIQQDKIRNAQKEYPDTGIPGYYFPIEINPQEPVVQDLFAQGYCTVIAIELEDNQMIAELIKQNLVHNGIHFEFIQLKHQNKPFQVSISIEEEHLMTKEVKLNNPNLIHYTIDDSRLIQLAQNAGLDVETINIGLYLRSDNRGKLYNYLPTDVASPFPFVDFHADFRTTLNRKNVNWDGAVGKYNKALFQACIELLFTLWKPEDLQLNTTYITNYNYSQENKESWHFNFLKSNFDINSETAKIISLIFNIDSWNYRPLVNWIGANTKVFFEDQDKSQQVYEEFYKVLIDFSKCITSDYNQKKHSKVEHLFSQLKESFDKNAVIYLPAIVSKEYVEVFFEKDKKNISSLLDLKFTTVEIEDSYEGRILRRALNLKDASDINEYLRFFRQTNLSGVVQTDSISEQQQIELLQNVYSFYIRKQERDSTFCERYANVLDVESREKNSLKNQARFSISTLFLKVKGKKYKPSQLCCIKDIDEEFRKALNLPDDFFSFLGVSTIPFIKVYDQRIYAQLDNGIDYIPGVISKNLENDRIDKNIVLNCLIHLRDKPAVHPALINDNYVELFPIIKLHHLKMIKSTTAMLLVKNYEQFSIEYFNILKDYLTPYLKQPIFYSILRNFYAYTFSLFHRNNHWIIFNGVHLEIVTHTDFVILKTKIDLDQAFEQRKSNFLIYESDRGLLDSEVLENKVISFDEALSFNETKVKEITNDIFSLFKDKLIYILYYISHDAESERNFIVNDSDILNRILNTKILVVENFAVKRTSKFLAYNYPENYRIDNKKIYLADETPKVICKAISEWLFSTSRFAEKIEVILFNRSTDDLVKECDRAEIRILNQKYNLFYQEQEDNFISLIKAKFPEIDFNDPMWNHTNSLSIQKIMALGKFSDLKMFLNDLCYSEQFKDYEFGFQIIELETNNQEEKTVPLQITNENNQVNYLIDKFSKAINSKKIRSTTDSSNSEIVVSDTPVKKRVIKNFTVGSSNSDLEVIGANGEHDILFYYVNNFLNFSEDEKENIVLKVFELLKNIISERDISFYENLKDNILHCFNKEELVSYLIPYLYVTLKYKYSYFDLIGFNKNEVFPVEIKTTNRNGRNDFYISVAEIRCALTYPNYEIVSVSPEEIIFLGNPIKTFKNQLSGFENEQYKLISTQYKIEILSHD